MNNRKRAEKLVAQLNTFTLGTGVAVYYDTPRAFVIDTYKPGPRCIFQLCRNAKEGTGSSSIFSGTAPEVCKHVEAMLEGFALAKEGT